MSELRIGYAADSSLFRHNKLYSSLIELGGKVWGIAQLDSGYLRSATFRERGGRSILRRGGWLSNLCEISKLSVESLNE